jgi:hypothetical protein
VCVGVVVAFESVFLILFLYMHACAYAWLAFLNLLLACMHAGMMYVTFVCMLARMRACMHACMHE